MTTKSIYLAVFVTAILIIIYLTIQPAEGLCVYPEEMHLANMKMGATQSEHLTSMNIGTGPGSDYILNVYENTAVPAAFEIHCICNDLTYKHPLERLFDYVSKEIVDQSKSGESALSVRFIKTLVEPKDLAKIYGLKGGQCGGFPKIVKMRRSGQLLEYKGYPGYAPLRDWIINEDILF